MGKKELNQFKNNVMKEKGYHVNSEKPDDVKYEVAKEQGIPLQEGYNGHLTSEQAGKVGGPIGRKHGKGNGKDGTGTDETEKMNLLCIEFPTEEFTLSLNYK